MPEQRFKSPQSPRRPLWILAAVAGLSMAFAAYFAYEAREARAKAVAAASELSAKERELAELRERERTRSATPMKAKVTPPPPVQRSARFDNRPAPWSAPPFPKTIPADRLPAVRQIVRKNQLRMLRSIYDSLLTQLNVSPEQRDRFYDLQLAVDDPTTRIQKIPGDDATTEERAQFQAQLQQIPDSALSQIQDILGSGGYQLYQTFRETQPDRMLAEQFRQQLNADIQMNDWQFAQLRDALIQTRTQYPPVGDDSTASHQAAVAQAAQFLTPEQLNTFRDYLHTEEEMQKEMRKLIAPLIGPGQ
ncbi:MAG: hypothetical protein ABIU29_01575 [Chthoniobacterales bacterium]